MIEADGRQRVVIEGVWPEIDAGRFPIKRVVGEPVVVEADVYCDGHDRVAGVLRWRHHAESAWRETPLEYVDNDRWRASFTPDALGRWCYTLVAWVDRFQSWAHDLAKRVAAGQDVRVDLLIGAELVAAAAARAMGADAERLRAMATVLREGSDAAVALALGDELAQLMWRHADRRFATTYDRELGVVVDPERARFSAWYELFPRSTAREPGRHGTFADVMARLPYVRDLGFDVLYLPPIHPIGRSFRKGRNNSPTAAPGDPGSPWAIGGPEGGHTAIHPELGTLDDFRRLVARARDLGIAVALDLAFQCSPDHPYVREHPEWFRWRPDGTIQYAENPPKKYQDIYPFDFESDAWPALWGELNRVVRFWIAQGVQIFRVDNPHTKPFAFWEWLIADIKRDHPEIIFLSEAFTRPKVMYRLAKLGFTQSYTYFAWRQTKQELTEYLTELTQTPVREFFRPNFWPNTPDILTEQLQRGGRPAFVTRLVLAATLSSNYGIYGPAFELLEHRPLEPGREEYLDSEKYEIKCWDWDSPTSLRELIARVNTIRRQNPALHSNERLRFHPVDNDQLIAYSKQSADGANRILVVVNLDPQWRQSGWLTLPLAELGLPADAPFTVHDLLDNARYRWQGPANYVELHPHERPAHIFLVQP
jgi:starch synthase (maltosyl-transferring)